MAITNKPLLNEWLAFLSSPAVRTLQQFGQNDDESTFNGATGCTHTILQILIYAKTGHIYSHDEISRIAGYPNAANNPLRRGMRTSTDPNSELMRVVRHFSLPYRPVFYSSLVTDAIWTWLCNTNNARGPVLVAVKYDWYPEHKGTKYNGHVADGRPNGYAEFNGATQITGFYGPHATLRAGYAKLADGKWHDFWREPNHGSPSRPERPAYDRFLSPQGKTLINSYRRLLVGGRPRSLMFVYPTATFHP